jgi:hypothetical protein
VCKGYGGNICCASGSTCVNGACCAPSQYCKRANICCPAGYKCDSDQDSCVKSPPSKSC